MTKQPSKGVCELCGDTYRKAGMTRHLRSCVKKRILSGKHSNGKLERTGGFHLVVEGYHLPNYWLHIEVAERTSLERLDRFLRDIWLECCNHLSAFTIQGVLYMSELSGDPWLDCHTEDMRSAIGDVVCPGMKFRYEYDFGATTELILSVVSEHESYLAKEPIRLLARNSPPLMTCVACGEIATLVCGECIYVDQGWLCDECAQDHECDQELLLPVVNSPRVGMCGYIGVR